MSAEDPDAWLEAFHPDELDDPELDEIDASVDRVLRRVGRAPAAALPARRSRAPIAVAAVAVAAGALLGSWWAGTGPVSDPAAPAPGAVRIEPAQPAPDPIAPAPHADEPTPGPSDAPPSAPRPVVVVSESGAEAPPVATPPEVVVAEAPLPGLYAHPGAEVVVGGDAAVLGRGLLSWSHDERHDPGVERVVWRDLPLVVRPVGTAFTVSSAPPLASVAVREGHVRVEHLDGSLLAALGPGEELTIAADSRSPLGLRLLQTDDLPLDGVAALAFPRCRCKPEELVAMVASLRLAILDPPIGVVPDLPEAP